MLDVSNVVNNTITMFNNETISGLFPTRARQELLGEVFAKHAVGNASELGRRCHVSPRMAGLVLSEFLRAGLVVCEGVGASFVYRSAETPVVDALRHLLVVAMSAEVSKPDPTLDAAMAWFGAPLLRAEPKRHGSLENAFANAAKSARRDPTLFKTLPVVLLKNENAFDWDLLRDCALRACSKAEVGMLLDVTAEVADSSALRQVATTFRDHRRVRMEFFFEPRNEFDEHLAKKRTPSVVRRWKYWMNMELDSLRSTVKKFEKVSS